VAAVGEAFVGRPIRAAGEKVAVERQTSTPSRDGRVSTSFIVEW